MTSLRRTLLGSCFLLVFALVAANLPVPAQDKKDDKKKVDKKDDKKKEDKKKEDKKEPEKKEPEKKEPPKLDTPQQTLKGHGNWVVGLAYAKDGARLVSLSRDRTVKVWDLKSGKDTQTLKDLPTEPKGMTLLGPDLRVAVSTGKWDAKKKEWLGELKIWDAAAGKEMPSKIKGHADSLEGLGVAATSDGKKVAAASMGDLVKVWDVDSGKELHVLKGHTDQILAVAFSADGKLIASGCKAKDEGPSTPPEKKDKKDKKAKDKDKDKDKEKPKEKEKQPAKASAGKTLILWNAETGKEIATFKGLGRDVTCVAFSPDGSKFAAGSLDGTIKILEAKENGKELHSLKAPDGVWTLAFNKDGTRLASGGWERVIKIWDVNNGTDLQTIIAHSGTVISVAFSPDGGSLASGGQDQLINIWKVAK